MLAIPNGSFEGGGSWVFSGTSGITGFPSSIAGVTQAAQDGVAFAYMNVMNTSRAIAGTMHVDIDVGPSDAGFYRLDGWYAANHYPVGVFGDGADFFSVYLDDDVWINSLNAYDFGYHTWVPLASDPFLFIPGIHRLSLQGVNQPLLDYSGTPWDGFLSYMLFDGLSLTFVAPPPGVRLTLAPGGGGATFSLAPGAAERLTIHD